MKTRSFKNAVIAGLLLAFGTGCGSGGYGTLPPGYNTFFPFSVTTSTPRVGDEQVPLTSPIKFKMSEQIQPASISSGVFKITETIGVTASDVTTAFIPSLEESNLTLTLTPTRPLVFGASYTVALNANLQSVSARQLASYTLYFTTGLTGGGGFGAISDPTIEPFVSDISLMQNVQFGCLAVQVTFNEDLQVPPTGSFKLSALRGSSVVAQGAAYFQPLYQNSYRDWVMVFDPTVCNSFQGMFARLDIKVSRAIDLTGQTMIGEKTAYFDQSIF